MSEEQQQERSGEKSQSYWDALESRAADLERELRGAQEQLRTEKVRREIDAELVKADAIDPEVLRPLVEQQLAQPPAEGKPKADARSVVARLRQQKAFLFKRPTDVAPSGATGVRHAGGSETPVARAAREAQETGDRRALLHYLRLKRQGR
jgi:hypothetical protein